MHPFVDYQRRLKAQLRSEENLKQARIFHSQRPQYHTSRGRPCRGYGFPTGGAPLMGERAGNEASLSKLQTSPGLSLIERAF
jgi:hypothetical protein